MSDSAGIRAIDSHSVHRITSGQVIVDLQSAIKELVENALDAGASTIDVRFQNYGLKAIEVVDNGTGIPSQDYDSIALKHYTSKLSSFDDLTRVLTFGFRGEALSSLCALSDGVTVTTATASDTPMGTILEIDRNGRVKSRNGKVARQRGTTVAVSTLFKPLPVRRKELERNIKREFHKTLNLLYAYALVPCSGDKGVRMTVTNQAEGGRKSVLLKTDGTPSLRSSVTALWGTRALDNIVNLDLSFDVEPDKVAVRRQSQGNPDREKILSSATNVQVQGLVSKFTVGGGRTASDRQFFFINGRPYNPGKVQKAFNEIYRTFNPNQSPFIVADFILPTHVCDINVSPDKRTIFLHSENNLLQALKESLGSAFESARSTFDVCTQPQLSTHTHTTQGKHGPGVQPYLTSSPPSPPASRAHTAIAERTDAEHTDAQKQRGQGAELIGRSVPHLLLEPSTNKDEDGEGEEENRPPSPTLVATASDTRARPHSRSYVGEKGRLSTSCAIKEGGRDPLFFPDDENGEDSTGDIANALPVSVTPAVAKPASRSPSEPVSGSGSAPLPLPASRSAPMPNSSRAKPRSVQTVLSTRGATWNLTRDADADPNTGDNRSSRNGSEDRNTNGSLSRRYANRDWGGGERFMKRARLSDVHAGPIMVDGVESEERDEDDAMDVDRDGGKTARKPPPVSDGQRPRPILSMKSSAYSKETLTISSDEDEDAMDVDNSVVPKKRRISLPEVTSLHVHTSRPSPPAPADSNNDAADPAVDWDISPTLVGNSVPQGPKSKSKSKPCTAPGNEDDVNMNIGKGKMDRASSCVILRVDLSRLHVYYSDVCAHRYHHARLTSSKVRPQTGAVQRNRTAVEHANLESAAPDNVASAALSRIISKDEFMHMDIIGQFNLGFIIVRKRVPYGDDVVMEEREAGPGPGTESLAQDDLFVVDQHAADEKWNFETLQEKTVIESQRLFRPRPLHLTAADELLAAENMDVLKKNGFDVVQMDMMTGAADVDPDEEVEEGSVHSGRLHLVAQPVSKDTVFDMKDLEELIHLMQDRPKGTMVRCSKARAMFAMRACRRSVMIGKPLDKSRMTSIVRHMGTMDQPWNCPHGRPTMRHLSDLMCFGGYDLAVREVDWESFGQIDEESDDDRNSEVIYLCA